MTRFTRVKHIVINHSLVPAFHSTSAGRASTICESSLDASLPSFSAASLSVGARLGYKDLEIVWVAIVRQVLFDSLT